MAAVFIIILVALSVGVFRYTYKYFLRAASLWNIEKDKKVKILAAVISLGVLSLLGRITGIIPISIMQWVIAGLIISLLNFAIVKLFKVRSVKWDKLYRCGIIPILITVGIITYGYYNMRDIVKKEYTVKTSKNIQDKGYKIGMISDLHFGVSINTEKLQEGVNRIEGEDIDVFILCGDIVDESTTFNEMQEAFKILGNVKSTFGTFYVYGNHDTAQYARKQSFTESELVETIEANDIKILADESYKVADDFTIIGRKDASVNRKSERKSHTELLDEVDKSDFLLMLDHQPRELDENSIAGLDLQLSGHTHSGQIWPGEQIIKLFNLSELCYGKKDVGNFTAITSSGVQGWGYPIRTGSKSEYVIVNVKS